MKDEGYNTIKILKKKKFFLTLSKIESDTKKIIINLNNCQQSSPVDGTFMGWLCIIYTYVTTLS